MQVVLRLPCASSKAHGPRSLGGPGSQCHIANDAHAIDVHAQTVTTMSHRHVNKATLPKLDAHHTLSNQNVRIPHLHPLRHRQQLNRQPGSHTELAKVRRWQLTHVEAQALTARAATHVHVKRHHEVSSRPQARDCKRHGAGLQHIEAGQLQYAVHDTSSTMWMAEDLRAIRRCAAGEVQVHCGRRARSAAAWRHTKQPRVVEATGHHTAMQKAAHRLDASHVHEA